LGNTSRLKAGTELHLAEVAEHGIALHCIELRQSLIFGGQVFLIWRDKLRRH
jgi:hypothetical protein